MLSGLDRGRPPLLRLTLLGGAFGLALLSCGRDVTAPGADARFARGIAWHTQFPAAYQAAGVAASGIVAFDRVRVLLHHSDGAVALDTVVAFGAGVDSVPLKLDVKLLPSAPASGEVLSLDLDYLDAAGDTVFKGGPVSVTAVPASAGSTGQTPVTVPVTYTGPGASAVGVQISPRAGTAASGNTFAFKAFAVDATGAPVLNTPIVWSSLDTAAATVPAAASGTVLAVGNARTTARIVAQLLTGPSDQVTLNVQPHATAIAIQSGSGQIGPLGALLTDSIVVIATAADGLGVSGVTVNFAVATGGGTVANASVVTSSAGVAYTTWTLGNTAGAQTATATAGTLTGSPLTFTATANSPAHLAVTTSPTAAQIAGATVTPGFVVTAIDANNALVTAFTGTVTLVIGVNPSGAALSGTTSVSAVAGVATFNAFSLNKVGNGYTVVASTSGYASGTSAAFNVATGPAATVAISGGNNQTGTASSTLPLPLSVTVTDAGGNPVSGITVHFLVTSGGGSVGTAAPVTNASGVATTTWTVGASGTQTVGAAALNATGQPLAGSPLVFTANGASAIASTTVAPHTATIISLGDVTALTATSHDVSNNVVAGTYAWVSRTPAVATVNPVTGVVTSVTNGTAYVVATELGGTKDSALVTVAQSVATISVTPNTRNIYLGAAYGFSASAVDGKGVALAVQPAFTWTTISSAIASITSGGVATGTGIGSTQVKATAGAVTGVATLNVLTPITRIVVARDSAGFPQTVPDTFTLAALGRSRSYKAIAYDTLNNVLAGVTFTFASSNSSVAAIDSTGTVTVRATAAANGSTSISAAAQGVTGAALLRVQQVLTAIDLSPTTATIAVNGQTALVARGKDANGFFIAGGTFHFFSSSTANATVGSTTGVVTGVLNGSATITAKDTSNTITSNGAIITVGGTVPAIISFGRDTLTVGRSASTSIPVYLSKPSASAITINLAVKDTFAFFSTASIVISAGNTSGNATLNGHNAGTTLAYASDGSSLGYTPDTAVLAVQATVHLTNSSYNLAVSDQVPTQVLLSDPSPAGGTFVTFSYGTPGRAQVSPDPSFIPAGQLAANVVILATGAGGTTITPAATGVNGTVSNVATSAAVLTVSPSTLRIGAGQYDVNNDVQSPQYLFNPVSVALASSDTTVATTPSPITIASGTYYTYFNISGQAPGLATIAATAANWTGASTSVRVTTPKLGINGGTTLNTTSPASGFNVYAEDSASGVHYRTSALAVQVTSSDTTVIKVATPALTIGAGANSVSSTVIPAGNGGTAWVMVSAGGHISDSTLYTVIGPKLSFGWSLNRIGVGQQDLNESVQGPNYVTAPLTVTIANPDSTVVGLPATVTIPTASYYTYFTVRGKALGTEQLIASAPGYTPDTASYVVTTPRLVLSGGTTLQNFAPAQAFTAYPADSTRLNHGVTAPLIVTYTSTNPGVIAVTTSTDTVQAGLTYANHGAVTPTGVGTAQLIASAPGYLPDTATYVVQMPKISFGFTHNYIGARQYDVSGGNVQTPNYLSAPLTVTIAQKHPAVDSLSTTSVVIPINNYYQYFDYAGMTPGTDTLIASAPGYSPDTAIITVTTAQLRTSGLPGTALTTSPATTVTIYAADSLNSIHFALDTIAITAVSSNIAVVQPTAAMVHLIKGTQYVQPTVAYTGPGTASVTYSDSAGVYHPSTTNTVTVTGPSLTISNSTTVLGMRQNGGTASANVQVANNVTGAPLVITLVSSDPTVVTVPATVTIPVGTYYAYFQVTAHDVIGTIQIQATAAGYGAATSQVQVTAPQFLISTAATLNTTSPSQTVYVYARDANNTAHYTNEDVAVTLASSSTAIGTTDSSTVVIAAGTQYNGNAKFTPVSAGTTQLSATDGRIATYRYNTATQNVAVNTPTLALWGTSMALGIGQYSDQTVQTADYQTSPLTVSFAHFNGASTTPSNVIIRASAYYNTVRVTGASVGADTVTASAAGENPVKSAMNVNLGRVDQNSNWPSTLSLAGTDSVLVTIYARDQASTVHFVAAATTFTLSGSANVSFASDGATITSATIPANAQSVQFWVKGTSVGTSSVSISNANYTTYAPSITVTP